MRRPRALALLLVLLPLVVLATATPAAHAQDGAIPLDDFRAALRTALDDLNAPDANADEVAAHLRAIGPVALADGTRVRPDLAQPIADLEAAPPRIDAARARLAALLSALEQPGANAPPDARATLDDILAREEFGSEDEEPPSLLDRALGWLADRVRDLLDRLPAPGGGDASGSPLLTLLMATLGIAIVVAIGVYAWLQLRRQATQRIVRAPDLLPEPRPTSLAALDEAARLRAAGDFRGALRWRYLATLLRLEEAGRLRLDRTLTNREVLHDPRVREDAALRAGLEPLVERFDRVWYGGVPCSAEDYDAFAERAARLDTPAREAA